MTVKQLKAFLKDKPANADVFFALWQSDDQYHNFSLHPHTRGIEYDKETGETVVCIGIADNCRAHKIILK